jgi:hypothetical protein
MAVKFTVKCMKCGKSRDTYNDPRLRRSVIECKASCFESHYEWEFVEEFDESAASPAASTPVELPVTAAAAAPAAAAPAPSSPQSQKGSRHSAASPKQAFAEEREVGKLEHPPPPQKQQNAPANKENVPELTKKRSGVCVML